VIISPSHRLGRQSSVVIPGCRSFVYPDNQLIREPGLSHADLQDLVNRHPFSIDWEVLPNSTWGQPFSKLSAHVAAGLPVARIGNKDRGDYVPRFTVRLKDLLTPHTAEFGQPLQRGLSMEDQDAVDWVLVRVVFRDSTQPNSDLDCLDSSALDHLHGQFLQTSRRLEDARKAYENAKAFGFHAAARSLNTEIAQAADYLSTINARMATFLP